jgi:hypothetical protein
LSGKSLWMYYFTAFKKLLNVTCWPFSKNTARIIIANAEKFVWFYENKFYKPAVVCNMLLWFDDQKVFGLVLSLLK